MSQLKFIYCVLKHFDIYESYTPFKLPPAVTEGCEISVNLSRGNFYERLFTVIKWKVKSSSTFGAVWRNFTSAFVKQMVNRSVLFGSLPSVLK